MPVIKIISGGQDGADRGGLDAAIELGLLTGGMAPRGYRTDKGPDPTLKQYGLTEHSSYAYPPRTKWNVVTSDGTLIMGNTTSPGSALTIRTAVELGKYCIMNPSIEAFRVWVAKNNIKVLNVAGNRESTNPGIHDRVVDFLVEALSGS